MFKIQATSTSIKSYEYDPKKQELHVEFQSGTSGTYSNVSQTDYIDFDTSPSKGRFLYQMKCAIIPGSKGLVERAKHPYRAHYLSQSKKSADKIHAKNKPNIKGTSKELLAQSSRFRK